MVPFSTCPPAQPQLLAPPSGSRCTRCPFVMAGIATASAVMSGPSGLMAPPPPGVSTPPRVTLLPYYSFIPSAWWIMMPLPYLVCSGGGGGSSCINCSLGCVSFTLRLAPCGSVSAEWNSLIGGFSFKNQRGLSCMHTWGSVKLKSRSVVLYQHSTSREMLIA